LTTKLPSLTQQDHKSANRSERDREKVTSFESISKTQKEKGAKQAKGHELLRSFDSIPPTH
jgi:hypothetical protein